MNGSRQVAQPVVRMYFIYSLLLVIGFIILLPRFVIDAFRHGKYIAGFRERWGFVHPVKKNGRLLVWIHCVSVGETQAARPLVRALRQRFPQHLIAVSTITRTGQNLAREVFKDEAVAIFYFPFDWRGVVRRSLRAIKPDVVLIMETELWPGFLRECEEQQIPVAVVNGRLSEQSFRRYRLIRPFMKRVLKSLTLAILQTEADAERLRLLGIESDKTFVSGNLKFDTGTTASTNPVTDELRDRFSLTGDAAVVLAASTHRPEEVILLNSFRQIIHQSELRIGVRPRLMIAPRHPERFSEVAELVRASGFHAIRRTSPASLNDRRAEVILLDSIGELNAIYPLASVVFVGGSIAKTGGHNILEPAALGVPVVTGSYTYNFQSIVETFVAAGAIIQLKPMSDSAAIVELANVISDLLADPGRRRELGALSQGLVSENRGATQRALQSLTPLLIRQVESMAQASAASGNNLPIS